MATQDSEMSIYCVIRYLRDSLLHSMRKPSPGFELNRAYITYEECLAAATGYGDECIAESVLSSTLNLIDSGEYIYERDGALFKEYPSYFPLREVLRFWHTRFSVS